MVYHKELGFVEKSAYFQKYKRIIIGESEHDIPIFECDDEEINGLDCFWVLPSDVKNSEQVKRIQRELIQVNITALEISKKAGYEMPNKMNDPLMNKTADKKIAQMEVLVSKFGFDPRDEQWIETELATTKRERNWFKFETENGIVFSSNWDDLVTVYNHQFNDNISIEEAKELSKKRMRYVLGAYNTRIAGNGNIQDWKKSAEEFEKFHRKREERMLNWTHSKNGKFPLVRVKKEIVFWPGPYFDRCIEKIPQLFTSISCNNIKIGTMLRVISYDPKDRYIRLDFLPDIRELIKPNSNEHPWIKDKADYDIWVKPEEIDDCLEIIDEL